MVSGTISLPSSGCFSPFPHGTRTLSVSREYLALPDGPGRFTQDSSCPALLRIPLGLDFGSCTGLSPSVIGLSRPFHSRLKCHDAVLQPRMCIATHTVWALPRSLATTGGIINLFSLPGGTKMFQFPPFASLHLVGIITLQVIGLSHSEIPGSMDICSYPGLIAAYHVLRRLREPRHPPCALSCFPTTPPSFLPPRSKKELRQEGGRPYFQLYSFYSVVSCLVTTGHFQHTRQKRDAAVAVFLLQSCLCQHVKDRCENPSTSVPRSGLAAPILFTQCGE